MEINKNSILRKIIYFVLFSIMIFAFIYLGEKFADNSKDEIITINTYYDDLDSENIEVISGSKFINLIKNGKSIVVVGAHSSEWSKKYISLVADIQVSMNIPKIYYYDIVNDKQLKNSNYYKIRELLSGSLITTDGSNNNLLAPCLYIFVDGEVKYYNIDTVAMKNGVTVDDYWKNDVIELFKGEIIENIDKYYLN